jgi:uncharacterized oxidoreductase
MVIQHDRLQRFIQAVFAAMGCEEAEADCISDHLVQANLVGHDSHGVIRTKHYYDWLLEEKVRTNRVIDVVVDCGAMAVVDCQSGFGLSAGKQAICLAIEKCREHGVAVIALRNSSHLGRIGHWAEMAIEAGYVSMHMVTGTGFGMYMVPYGGKDRRLSLNPIAVGIPVEGGDAIVLDFAASMIAEGKLKVALNKGMLAPDGCIIDAEGRPTNDINLFYGPPMGAILPFGEHKGYGLALAVELLVGALTGGGCSREGMQRLEQSMLSILIDPLRLQTAEALYSEVRRYIDFVKSSRTVSPDGEILVPGDIERRTRSQRLKQGIELDDETWRKLVETARAVAVSEETIRQTVEL